MSFLNNVGIFLRIFLNKSKIFPIKNQDKALTPEPTNEPACQMTKAKTKCKISPLKLHDKILNEIENEEKNINK